MVLEVESSFDRWHGVENSYSFGFLSLFQYNSPSLRSDLNDSTNSVFTYDQETLTDLQRVELDAMESFFRQKQGEVAEHSTEIENQENLTEDKCTTTQLVLEDLDNMETIYNEFQNGLLKETCEYPEHAVLETEDKESMTDLAWLEISSRQIDSFSQIYLEDGLQREKGEVYRVEKETMTDLYLEELRQLGNNSQKYVEESISLRPRDNKGIMTDVIWEELIERTNEATYSDLRRELDAQWKGKGREAVDVGVMTDLALLELVEMENKYFEYTENESVVDILKDDNVEALPEIVLDTFPEDPASRKDNYVMTELRWEHIIDLENKCSTYEHDIEELERAIADSYVVKDEKNCGTDLSYRDIIAMQEKCLGYECVIEELEKRLAQFDVEKSEKGTGTEISLKDLCNDRFTCDMRGEDTLTNEIEGSVNVVLPRIVQETFPGDVQTKDECDMTDGVWEEVEELKNTYLDYRQNLEEMKNKLAQFEVEKDDKESLTDIAMQDLADLESIYKEHLREVDSDTNSMLSNVEKESRECMTELTAIEITELEDFYIENAANQLPQSPIVEKWEQESMTEITLNEMQYLDETEELYRQKVNGGPKVDKCTETDLTTTGIDSKDEEPKILAVDKQDAEVMTEMALSDLQYLEGVEQANAECLVDTELEPEALVVDKQDAEVMTEMALSDLQYLEGVEQAYSECLVDTELKPEALVVDKQDAEVMTEMALSDLQYLEGVEQANAECLVDTELELEALVVDKQDAEVMTEMALSDLQYLEGVEQANAECLVDTELEPKAFVVDKQDVEVMTEIALSDLQYLEDVEQAHEECRVDTEVEPKTLVVDKQDVEVMTEMPLSGLLYLEDDEQAHEECLADEEEEPNVLVMDKPNAEIMTEMADLHNLEKVESPHEECLADEVEVTEVRSIPVEKESVEIMTDMNVVDLQSSENKLECFENSCKNKANAQTMTDLTLSELHLLEDNLEELRADCTERCNAEIMTDLTGVDLNNWKETGDVQEALEECFAQTTQVEMENVEIMTDLTVLNLQYLETVECAHQKCLAVKHSVATMNDLPNQDPKSLESSPSAGKERRSSLWRRKSRSSSVTDHLHHKNTMTEMTGNMLEYYEDIEGIYKETVVKMEEMKTLLFVEKQESDVMTDLTAEDLEYLEEESEKAREGAKASVDEKVMTELTHEDLEYLIEVEMFYKDVDLERCKRDLPLLCDATTMTELSFPDVEYAEKELYRLRQKRSQDTDSSWVVIEPAMEDKNVMTEIPTAQLNCPKKFEVHHMENMTKSMETACCNDAETMTDLTLPDIEYLEEAENLLKTVSGNGGDMAALLAPKDDKEVITDLVSSDIDYLVLLGDIDRDGNRDDTSSPEKDDKHTETELTIADIRDLEDQVHDATGRKTVSSFQEFGNEDLLPETQVSLQSELEYLPVLDETEFILLDEDEDVISRRETEVMTELTISDIRDLEDQVVSARNFKAPHVKENFEVETLDSLQSQLEYLPVLDEPEFILDDEEDFMQRQDAGVMTEITLFDLEHLLEDEILGNECIVKSFEKKDNTSMTELTISELAFLETSGPCLDNEVLNTADISEAAIQCDLENLSSLMQELNREAEEHGEYFPAWFVTALSLRRPELGLCSFLRACHVSTQ